MPLAETIPRYCCIPQSELWLFPSFRGHLWPPFISFLFVSESWALWLPESQREQKACQAIFTLLFPLPCELPLLARSASGWPLGVGFLRRRRRCFLLTFSTVPLFTHSVDRGSIIAFWCCLWQWSCFPPPPPSPPWPHLLGHALGPFKATLIVMIYNEKNHK